MADREWTPAWGWAKLSLYLPIRMALALGAVLAMAWVYNKVLDGTGVTFTPILVTFGFGFVTGLLAGIVLCFRLSDSVGHAGRTLLPVVYVAAALMLVVAWNVIPMLLPWGPFVMLWFVGASGGGMVLPVLRCLWVNG